MDIYLFSGTHWDREWYQTFQGFRVRLVKMMDGLLDILENDENFGVFHLDGQTIVLEDYLEIRPENRGRLEKLIQKGKLMAGPWYCMPDEFLLSGESLIKNLQRGFQIVREYGVEPMKYGYICDVFGHIAQMPQIFSEMGIHNALLGRGTNEHTTPMHFVWEAPDGSRVTAFKLQDAEGYGAFYTHVLAEPSKSDDELRTKIKDHVDSEIARANVPVLLLMDALDHQLCHEESPKYLEMIRGLYPEANVHHTSVMDMCEQLKAYEEGFLIKQGEVRETAKAKAGSYMHLITNTLSSRYPIKQANDILQSKLEKWVQPLFAFGLSDLPLSYLEIANKYLMLNHPHDSICGCSIDAVHTDMEYRFHQGMQICDEIVADWVGITPAMPKDGTFEMRVYHPLPYHDRRVISLTIPFPQDYSAKYQEPFGYESINSFCVTDMNGNELEYGIADIKRGQTQRYYAQKARTVDLYTIRVEAELIPMGFTSFFIQPMEMPSRHLSRMKYGERFADNGIVRIEFAADGTMSLYDYATAQQFDGLLTLSDDGEIGDGWFHVNPACDRVYTATAHELEIEHNSAIDITFKLTQLMMLPAAIDDRKRSKTMIQLRAEHHITLMKNVRVIDIRTEIDNNVKDHRLRLKLPTAIEGKTYFANQAFCFVERSCDFDLAAQNYRECEPLEKQMAGIVGKKNEQGGLAFISEYGLHECGVTSAGDIYITLFRAFGTTVMTNGESGGQLLQRLNYSYQLMPFGDDMAYADLQKRQDELQAGVVSFVGKPQSEATAFEVRGKHIVYSTAVSEPDGFSVRVYNDSDETQSATLVLPEGAKAVMRVNLDGKVKEELAIQNGCVIFEVKRWGIETVRVVQDTRANNGRMTGNDQ